jgi:signal transduction histidine kinase
MYHIAQEALTNAARHARARRVVVHLDEAGGVLTLSVQDDGVGLSRAAGDRGGMGRRLMRYRAGAIGATLAVARRPAGGTLVTCRLSRNGQRDAVENRDG